MVPGGKNHHILKERTRRAEKRTNHQGIKSMCSEKGKERRSTSRNGYFRGKKMAADEGYAEKAGHARRKGEVNYMGTGRVCPKGKL